MVMTQLASAVFVPDEFSHRRKRRILLALWAVFWVLMLSIEIQDQLANPYIRWWEPVIWMATSLLGATAWLVWQMHSNAKMSVYLDRPLQWFWQHLKWFPLIAVTFVTGVYALRHGFYASLGLQYRHESWAFVYIYETIKLWLFLGLWLGIIFALDSFGQWQAQRRRLAALQRTLAEAQLAQLKAQLRPHFLFNALNTISSVMQTDVARADRLLTRLGDLLRATLRTDQEDLTTLQEELDILRLYAEIMEERFAERVRLQWHVESDVANALLPTMLLQPLLENAFKHGVERASTAAPAFISIDVRRTGEQLKIRIANSGSLSDQHGDGIGLRNCRERLRVHYGEQARVALQQADDVVEVCVSIPWRVHPS